MLDTSVSDILFENGEVTGVRLTTEENETVTVATKSVIVATGGFSANSQMVVKYRPDLAGFVTTNHKGATGGGIALLERIGAGTVDMGEIQIHPTVEQKTSYLISESIRGGGAILVNQQGNRFFNEMETRDKVSAQIIALPEKYAYIVFDEHVRAKNKAADEYIAKGFVTSASSPKALAETLGMDYHAFLATLERYNGFVEKQHDDDFGRTTALRAPINEGPFHAIQIAPGVHHTMGGVTINTETCVLDNDHQVIPGRSPQVKWLAVSTVVTVLAVTQWQISLFLVRLPDIRQRCVRKCNGLMPGSSALTGHETYKWHLTRRPDKRSASGMSTKEPCPCLLPVVSTVIPPC
jgi:fumarate reductase flavoprotein subunit